jgi:inhibitor of KinA
LQFIPEYPSPFIYLNGTNAVTIAWRTPDVERANLLVISMQEYISEASFPWCTDLVPAYHSLTVFFDAGMVPVSEVQDLLQKAVQMLEEGQFTSAQKSLAVLEIPVCYDPELAPDINTASAMLGISMDELVSLHSQMLYRVYMLGFVPGFPYMGFTDERIALPRLSQPRLKVPAGSVGIAGRQTGIYPLEISGGWQIIGRTPIRIFDAAATHPFYFKPGDQVRFVPISLNSFHTWSPG